MFCTNCGSELRAADRFCSQCGKPAGAGAPIERRLTLVKEGKKIGGVCTGFARYLDLDVTLVRIVWLALAITTGIGFIAYLVAWLLMPKDPAESANRSNAVTVSSAPA